MKVSIITINYNNYDGLKQTINSIYGQTYKGYEWIVVDGGSTDGSRELIEEYAAKGCFAWWCSEHDEGIYNAMNKGIKHAQGEYLNFMNSGDCFYEPSTLKQVFEGKEYNADVIYGCYEVMLPNGSSQVITLPEKLGLDFIRDSNICHQAIFQKRETLSNPYYDESYSIYADWAKWRDWLMEDRSFKYVPITICKYDMNGISQTQVLVHKKERIKYLQAFPQSINYLIDLVNKERFLIDSYPICEINRMYKRGGFSKIVIKTVIWLLRRLNY